MEKKDQIREELEELGANNLANWHKRSVGSHSLPDDYWDDHIDRAITVADKVSGNKHTRQFSLSYIVTIAAGFLILLAGTWLFFQQTDQGSGGAIPENEWTTISAEEIVKYIDANLDDFDLALLSDYAQETESDLFFELDASVDSLEDNWAEDTEWLMPVEEGVDLF